MTKIRIFIFIIPFLILFLFSGCQNQPASTTTALNASISQSRLSDMQSLQGEWLVLYETYEVLNDNGELVQIVTNMSSSITDSACYTLLFKTNFTADIIDYTNGAVSNWATNYYYYTLHEDTMTIDLISPIDVEETIYYEPIGGIYIPSTNIDYTNTNFTTNYDSSSNIVSIDTNVYDTFSNYQTVVYTNFTSDYQVTNVSTDQIAVFTVPEQVYDTAKVSKKTISVFTYKFTIDTNGRMYWRPSLEVSHTPESDNRSHTTYTTIESKGTNGYYELSESYEHYPEFNSIVNFQKQN